MEKITQSALDTAQLPSLPELVSDLQSLIDRNEDMEVIADLLATDTALATRVIELANSAYYGNQNITRIFEAVKLIGLKRIILFVRTAYTIDILKSMDGTEIDMSSFWTRSFVAGLISRNIAERINFPEPETMYTAGLLMYVGELIMALLPAHVDIEGLSSEYIAAAQMKFWGFPELLVEAIRHYKQPSLSSDRYALPVSMLHLTDCIVFDKLDNIDSDALQVTHLDMKEISDISRDFEQLEL